MNLRIFEELSVEIFRGILASSVILSTKSALFQFLFFHSFGVENWSSQHRRQTTSTQR